MTLPDNDKAKQRMIKVNTDIDMQFNVVRGQLKHVQSRHDVLKRMRDNLKQLHSNVVPKVRMNIETDLLNDYHYLKAKT